MFFPYRDDNPRILVPYVTYGIIAINTLVFLFQLGLDFTSVQEFTLNFGLIPATLTNIPPDAIVDFNAHRISLLVKQPVILNATPHSVWLTVFTSMFMHGGIVHILGNMWFLWIFGDNVESAFGHARYALFYILCGLGAAFTQIAIDITSMVPMIGASGAISGVLAAYMVRFPHARVHVFVFLFIFFTTIQVPAFVVIGIWFLEQLTNGLGSLGLNTTGGVAWFAHIGGFMSGILLNKLFRSIRIEPW
ncbi:MAG: rhomboid family intramembrane serine protease [FCB group bacterium]|nr:rhomboid family intramembrane serine protease [FCB group bacterium]